MIWNAMNLKSNAVEGRAGKCVEAIAKADHWLRNTATWWFVLANLVLSYVVVLPAALGWSVLGHADEFGGPSLSDGPITTLVVVCIFAPLVETFQFQWLPIRLMQKIKKVSAWHMVVISAALFGASHWYSLPYVFFAACVGLVLAYAFIIRDEAGKNAFWPVFMIHALRNLFTFLLFFMT